MTITELTNRQVNILFAIVKEYVDTGGAIGSNELRNKYGFNFSPATIRNETSVLRNSGYLEQEFTNSPNKPTEKAYKLFVSRLIEGLEVTNKQQKAFKNRILELQEKQTTMSKQIARLLADSGGGVGFSLTNDGEDIKGLSNLLTSQSDGKVGDILNFLDNLDEYKKHLLPGDVVEELIDSDSGMKANKSNIKMIIGDENPVIPLGKGYAMISTHVELDNGERSVVGVITPTHLLAKKKNIQLLQALNNVLGNKDKEE